MTRSFFLLTIAFLAMCTMAVALTVALSADGAGRTMAIVGNVAFVVAALLLWFEARQDLDAVLTLLSFFLLATTICVTIYLFTADAPGTSPKLTALVAGAAAIGLGATTLRRQRGPESADFPNLLKAQFQPDALFETAGVQFAGLMQEGDTTRPHRIAIFLQNCFNTPRKVTVRFDAANYAKYLRFQPQHQLQLGPAEVCRVTFPIVAPAYPGSYPLYFSVSVSGSGGRRVRRWRAREVSNRVKPEATAALLMVGVIAWGGGIRFTIGPLPADLWNTELGSPVQESLWQPQVGTVPLLQPSA